MFGIQDAGDVKQTARTIGTLSAEGARVLLGCFLMIFVSQKCGDTTCTASQAMDLDDPARLSFYILHILSAIVVFLSFGKEAKRERWLIENFDTNPAKPDAAMKSSWERFPERHQEFITQTKQLQRIVELAGCIYAINLIGTSIFLLGWHWNGVATLTGLGTQALLVIQSLSSTWDAAKQSLRRNVPVSTVLTEPTVFNEWDENLNTNQEMKDISQLNETIPTEEPEEATMVKETTETETNADEVQLEV